MVAHLHPGRDVFLDRRDLLLGPLVGDGRIADDVATRPAHRGDGHPDLHPLHLGIAQLTALRLRRLELGPSRTRQTNQQRQADQYSTNSHVKRLPMESCPGATAGLSSNAFPESLSRTAEYASRGTRPQLPNERPGPASLHSTPPSWRNHPKTAPKTPARLPDQPPGGLKIPRLSGEIMGTVPFRRKTTVNENRPNRQDILAMAAGFETACVLGAAAELDLFTTLAHQPMAADQVATRLGCDPRAIATLLDAVTALGLLDKHSGRYAVPEDVQPWLVDGPPESVLPMILHRMNILRSWSQLAWVAKSGVPCPRTASIRGAEADRAAFVAAMHAVSGPMADGLVARLGPQQFTHLLDVGGASGTWTLAWLRAVAGARATIFDLPDAIEQARTRIAASGLADRITLVPGDFYRDDLPAGADFAWVSAICHQHDREHNRALFAKVLAALQPGERSPSATW